MTDRPLDTSTRLAFERTRLAQERTLMAWIRTSTSLIAFGFTIFKFFQYMSRTDEVRQHVLSPWLLGMFMIVLGIAALGLASLQHRREMKILQASAGPLPQSIAWHMATLIAVLGVVALVLVVFRI